ncbi:MAG: hypothetical protein JSW71_12800 [Gemmatimonadota bacterium]|nr:MAG: hypothetical protein JSW71_12800 [Gemmatimonadota bacterium]
MKRATNERGIALLVAVLGLLVSGSLISAFVILGVLEHRMASNTRRVGQAFSAAEHGLSQTVGNWNSTAWNTMAVNDSVVVSGVTPGGTGSYAGLVRRLNNEMFVVDIAATDGAGGARQRLGAFVKLRPIDMDIRAALTTRGQTRVGGNAAISGVDSDPSGWTGCPPDSSVSGIMLPSVGDLETIGGCSSASCIDGSPPVGTDPNINDSTFFEYGDVDWAELVAMATKVLPPGTYTGVQPSYVSGRCDTPDPRNWGDPFVPTSDCGSYFPIIYISGDASVNGNYGQGILLVDGNLSVQGGFQFYGIVIVRQALETTGTGGHFNGAVLAANVDLDQATVLGDALIQYSQCATKKVLSSAAPGALLRSRAWFHAY